MSKIILIIDDEAELLATIESVLSQRGYTVLTAGDGEQGVQVAKEKRPDLVITDLNMPNLDGWRVCQRIKQEAGAPPVIMLSALVASTHDPVEIEMGDSYLSKPFKMADLLEEVRRFLPDSAAA